MPSIFNAEQHQEILDRVEKLNSESQGQWGKMTVAQMAYHCQGPLNIILQKNDYGLKPNWFIKTFFKSSMYNDKAWRKNLPTAPQFKVAAEKDFNKEKAALVQLINELHEHREKIDWQPHPTFGTFTADQWGKMQYKHLDHHLRQFGA